MEKIEKLQGLLKSYEKIAIAYSGGCDSNFLMNVAINTLGKENVLCVVCIGDMMSKEDIENARALLKDQYYIEIDVNVFDVEEFKHNDKKRCYHCKKMIMSNVIKQANDKGFSIVCDGKNKDDELVYRPGNQALEELGIISPLAISGMVKKEIRYYSKEMGISTHDKPANACLASRFDYGTLLTKEKLELVDKAEALFHEIGILQVRVRVQEQLVRIEINKEDFDKVYQNEQLVSKIKELGFRYITLDLEGIKSGSYD